MRYNRKQFVLEVQSESNAWDVIIIGGGASGLGAGVESTTRGYKTLLLEQYDFTKGTSSRSTKLVHGGVRYLAQGNISLVFSALKERGFLCQNAPHLVSNLSFLIPSYSWWSIPFYTFGLTIYDLLAGKLSFGISKPQSKRKTIAKLPTVNKTKLRGSVLYHDGQFDDSRLGINLAQTIIDKGGTAINYMKVVNVLKTKDKICGVEVLDQETGKTFGIKSKTILNATGIFVDSILRKDDVNAKPIVQPSQGVHLVFDKKFLPSKYALMIPKTKDGRVLFAVPWHNKVVIGTTDVPKKEVVIEPKATNEEIDFILETAGRFLEKKPKRTDVKSVFAGLRPLAVQGDGEAKTKEISRGHKIYVSKSGLITIIGGKWTTYREMGEEVINRLARVGDLPSRQSVTQTLHLHGYKEKNDSKDSLCFYGSDAGGIRDLIIKNSSLAEWVSVELKISKAQVVWAVKNEFARTVEDVLARRTRALFLDAAESIRMAKIVAEIIAKELKHDNNWEKEQVIKFTKLAAGYLLNA